jgi:hypothetical protein
VARVLFNKVWFESVRSQSWYEADYEQIIFDYCQDLFPQWIPAPFKTDVIGEDGTIKRPDLALIDRSYREWWVVEVELAHHNLRTHVMPQVEAFRTATYERRHAEYLHARIPMLDLGRLADMMLGLPPEVLVVVDRPDTDWLPELHASGVHLSIVEPFRDPSDHLLLRVNGHRPEPPASVLTRCSRHALRRLWRVHSPAALPAATGDDAILEIEFDGGTTPWKRLQIADAVLLCATRGDILTGWRSVDLVRDEDGGLKFKPVTKE